MFLALLFLGVAVAPKIHLAWPIGPWNDMALGLDLTGDYTDGYYGPWSPDYMRYMPYGVDYPHLDAPVHGHGMDYYHGPRTVDVAKENYVRDYPYGGTEFGMRDSVTVRPGGRPYYPGRFYGGPPYMPRAPYHSPDWSYNPFYGDDLLGDHVSPYYRRLFASGLASPRPSSLRTGGDLMFLRR